MDDLTFPLIIFGILVSSIILLILLYKMIIWLVIGYREKHGNHLRGVNIGPIGYGGDAQMPIWNDDAGPGDRQPGSAFYRQPPIGQSQDAGYAYMQDPSPTVQFHAGVPDQSPAPPRNKRQTGISQLLIMS